jgi:hypothetical protein
MALTKTVPVRKLHKINEFLGIRCIVIHKCYNLSIQPTISDAKLNNPHDLCVG